MPIPDFEARAVASQALAIASAHIEDPDTNMPFEIAPRTATVMMRLNVAEPDSSRRLKALLVVAIAEEDDAPRLRELEAAIRKHLRE